MWPDSCCWAACVSTPACELQLSCEALQLAATQPQLAPAGRNVTAHAAVNAAAQHSMHFCARQHTIQHAHATPARPCRNAAAYAPGSISAQQNPADNSMHSKTACPCSPSLPQQAGTPQHTQRSAHRGTLPYSSMHSKTACPTQLQLAPAEAPQHTQQSGHTVAMLPLSSAPTGRGADGVVAMA
jgi:hypothetical protein